MSAARDVWITPDSDVRITPDADVVIVNDGLSTISVALAAAYGAVAVALLAASGPIAVSLVYTAPGELTPAGDFSALLLEGDSADDVADGLVLEGDMAGGLLLLEGDMA